MQKEQRGLLEGTVPKRDVQLVHQTVREGRPVTPEVRERIMRRLMAVVEGEATKLAVVVAVFRLLVAMDRANLAQEKPR